MQMPNEHELYGNMECIARSYLPPCLIAYEPQTQRVFMVSRGEEGLVYSPVKIRIASVESKLKK